MAVLTSDLNALFSGGEIMICSGSGRLYCWLRSLTWVNQEFLMLWWRMYNPCLVENVGGAEEGYHMEEGVLVLVDQSWGREGAR